MRLVIGNKNYSSWSLRPWLLMTHFELEFDEVMESLGAPNLSQRLAQYSTSKKVPVLLDGDIDVWDSLAICEYISEQHLDGKGWPSSVANRALARALSAQMHSGFNAVRNEMPMNIRATRLLVLSQAAQDEIVQIQQLWQAAITTSSGPWLAGEFSIVDCMFAPVVMRFITYGVELTPSVQSYVSQMTELPAMQQWITGALQESEVVEMDEAGH